MAIVVYKLNLENDIFAKIIVSLARGASLKCIALIMVKNFVIREKQHIMDLKVERKAFAAGHGRLLSFRLSTVLVRVESGFF